ncbi:uncharacterized protein HaLaN_22542 [Haematococcus lacustris]|nr:uncharacterized protein HaLaN_22542 [Haematococcus lacustris]
MVALSPAFCKYLLPKLQEFFPDKFAGVTAEQLYAAINKVMDPSYIRVESDEVTYPMHVIIRYEIEKGLLEGSIKVEDVPKEWNSRMEQYLGCTPPSDAQGCLQIYNKAASEIPDLDDLIAAGNFKPLKEWLNEKVHKLGSLHSSGDELMVAVTGDRLQPSVLLQMLEKKYSALYKLHDVKLQIHQRDHHKVEEHKATSAPQFERHPAHGHTVKEPPKKEGAGGKGTWGTWKDDPRE